ncbi:MAG TPA: glycoside hydrolase family 15 [Dermatophilaceae bacterium]|nr:glycoside hydrolase family 15 [Dermatophilaceae bacterium]
MRRRLAWSAAVLSSVALLVALISATATATPEAQPGLLTSPGWRVTQDVPGPVPRGPNADVAWLSRGSVPGEGTRWEPMVRTALLDLHQLSEPNGAVAAGPGGPWNYAWPRDTAFVAVALARSGHHPEALRALTFLQRAQLGDGGFEARYLLDGSGPPDDRARQSDGAGWALWAAWEVSRAITAADGVGHSSPALRPLLDNATGFALATTDDGHRLPAASPDYWEVGVRRTTLGTVAPLLAGLAASQRMYAALGERALAERSGAAAARLRTLVIERFAGGYERFGSASFGSLRVGGGGLDAAVTFLMPPFAGTPAPQVVDAWTRYQSDALRPAGGLAPGSRWKQDGISWTPETALVAYTAAMSGRPAVAAHWMDWLGAHRPEGGSLPEKVLASGAPAGPAPLAWTAALVVLTAAALDPVNAP